MTKDKLKEKDLFEVKKNKRKPLYNFHAVPSKQK